MRAAATAGSRTGWIVAGLAYVAGVVWRGVHLLVLQPATEYVYSDMQGYVERARWFGDPSYVPSILDTIYPPGAHVFFGLLYRLDPSWQLAMVVQLVISAAIPLLVALLARELYGSSVALVALFITSLYFPLIDYAGYFLAENPFTVSGVVAMLLLVRALKIRRYWPAMACAVLAGVGLGLAASMKSVILAPALLIALCLAFVAWRRRSERVALIVVAAALGLGTLLMPMAARCTSLAEGQACLISRNGGINVLLGHYGDLRVAHFVDSERGSLFVFARPVATARPSSYTKEIRFRFGAYDTGAALAEAWRWSVENPVTSLLLSGRHVLDLFAGSVPWPAADTDSRTTAIAFQRLYLATILLPACLFLGVRWYRRSDFSGPWLAELLLLLPLAGLMIAAFLTHGSPRIRTPFDPYMIVLAARAYAGSRAIDGPVLPRIGQRDD